MHFPWNVCKRECYAEIRKEYYPSSTIGGKCKLMSFLNNLSFSCSYLMYNAISMSKNVICHPPPPMLFAKGKMCEMNLLLCWKTTLCSFSHVPSKGMHSCLVSYSYLQSNKLLLIFIIKQAYTLNFSRLQKFYSSYVKNM